jgi:hypothetical protein
MSVDGTAIADINLPGHLPDELLKADGDPIGMGAGRVISPAAPTFDRSQSRRDPLDVAPVGPDQISFILHTRSALPKKTSEEASCRSLGDCEALPAKKIRAQAYCRKLALSRN